MKIYTIFRSSLLDNATYRDVLVHILEFKTFLQCAVQKPVRMRIFNRARVHFDSAIMTAYSESVECGLEFFFCGDEISRVVTIREQMIIMFCHNLPRLCHPRLMVTLKTSCEVSRINESSKYNPLKSIVENTRKP